MRSYNIFAYAVLIPIGCISVAYAQEGGVVSKPKITAVPSGQQLKLQKLKLPKKVGTKAIIITFSCGSGTTECEARAEDLEAKEPDFSCTSVPGGIECTAPD